MGLFRIHGLPGERKSGTPLSVEMPAPVNPTTVLASAIKERRSMADPDRTFMRIVVMDAILGDERCAKRRASARAPLWRNPKPQAVKSMALELAVVGGARRGRWQAIDVGRGAAIAAMIVYHFAWDLSYFHLIAANIVGHPFWQAFARTIAGSFLTLVGIGLVLAHGQELRGRAFLRRLVLIAGAAVGVTLATWFAFPDSYIFFGILHCIALSSVLALPFLRARLRLVIAAALLCLVAPLVLTGPAFDAPPLAFLGLGHAHARHQRLRARISLVRAGAVGCGAGAGGAALGDPGGVAGVAGERRPFRALAWSGRRSLPIYLTHQPILLGALFLVAQIAGSDPAADSAPFLAHCRTTCREADKAESLCRAACVCVVERLLAESLWRDAVASRLTPRDQARIGPMAQRCFEEVEPALRDPHSPDVDPSETQP